MKEDYYVTVGINHHDNKFDGNIQRFFLNGLNDSQSQMLWALLRGLQKVNKK